MNTDLDSLVRHGDRVRERADQACAAAEGLARAANGTNGHVIPAPVAYDLLGNVKVLLWYLREVAEFLPTGVAHSLTDDRLAVYDRGPGGDDRDAAGQWPSPPTRCSPCGGVSLMQPQRPKPPKLHSTGRAGIQPRKQ